MRESGEEAGEENDEGAAGKIERRGNRPENGRGMKKVNNQRANAFG